MLEGLKPWEKVSDPSYFRKVLGNMAVLGFGPKQNGKAFTRFGILGTGYAPNYQIEWADGSVHCFTGMDHKEVDRDEFDAENLSGEKFTYSDIQQKLARLIDSVQR